MSQSTHSPIQTVRLKWFVVFLLVTALSLRLFGLYRFNPFFADQDWFYRSAVRSVMSGRLPVTGITASIIWLHQGPLWTYLLIPALVFSGYHPLSGSWLILGFSLVSIPLIYYLGRLYRGQKAGIISAFIYTWSFFPIVHSRIAYHTSPIPLFTLVTFLLLFKNRQFFAGLFLGFLYQLHLLTFIFWPLALFLSYRRRHSPAALLAGFVIGIFPLILAGPIQVFGIFGWLLKFVLGKSPSSGISVSYQVVFMVPAILLAAGILSRLKSAYLLFLGFVFLIFNLFYLVKTGYLTTYPDYRPVLSDQILTSSKPGSYLFWWSQRQNGIKITP